MLPRYVIIGAGFRGLVLSYLLSRKGFSVTLLESGKHAGGVLNGLQWHGFQCDFGCHLFDNTQDQVTELIFQMCGGSDNFTDVNLRYGSITGDHRTEDVAVADFSPDFLNYGETWLKELKQSSLMPMSDDHECLTLSDALYHRFGANLSSRLFPIAAKIYATEPGNLDYSTINQGLLTRVRIADNGTTKILKKDPVLDQKIAIHRSFLSECRLKKTANSLARNFYPIKRGMRGFLDGVLDQLRKNGVKIYNCQHIVDLETKDDSVVLETSVGQTFLADYVISTVQPSQVEGLLGIGAKPTEEHYVPMIVLYGIFHESEITKITYLHDFNPAHRVFRVSTQGLYSNQITSDGNTFICVECPCSDSDFFDATDEFISTQIFLELDELRVIKKGARPLATKLLKIPKAIQAPTVGSSANQKKAIKTLTEKHPRLLHFYSDAYGKSVIVREGLEFINSLKNEN